MHIKSFAARAVGAVAVLAFAGAAAAQAPAAKPAGPAPLPVTHGAPIAGICVWNVGQALETSNAGKGMLNALNVMKNNVNYELTNANNAFQAAALSSPSSSRAATRMSWPFQLISASGWASRLWVQAG